MIIAALDKRENRIIANKCLNNITFLLINIQTGEVCIKFNFRFIIFFLNYYFFFFFFFLQ